MLRTAFIEVGKTTVMNFKFFIISVLVVSGLVGSAFAQQTVQLTPQEFTQEEIDEMKHKAVLITLNEGTFMIELFPEVAPNHVHNFLKLIESGYYDGMVFHRIIPGFMIQVGDPNTKDPEIDRSLWGTGGPGYQMDNEFNSYKHDRGIVSMARQNHQDTAGSQFFIVHQDSHFLDGQYTVFGRLAPGFPNALNDIANLPTDSNDAPIDAVPATIIKTSILEDFSSPFGEPRTTESIIKQRQEVGGMIDYYRNYIHDVQFDVPFRWLVNSEPGDHLSLTVKPDLKLEHNVVKQMEQSNFIPQILINSEDRKIGAAINEVNTGFFSILKGDEPKTLSSYVFENDAGMKAKLHVTTQTMETETGTVQFKIIQINFNSLDKNYSIIYVNVTEWFRYEINAFITAVENFEIMIDGEMRPIGFSSHPVYKQVLAEAKEKPLPESLPPARIGGCLIATASFGSELAPQVQLLREIRDNTVLQTQSGTSFMNGFNHIYYSFSPAIADYERESPVFKEAVKLTLTPLLASLTLLQYVDIDSEHEMLGFGIGLILLNIGMYFVAPAVLITKIRSFYKLQ